ncbi:RDD family protein [Kitasatospora sp. MAA19]|uniref:RDD family protein n=1 Tax=Kitasatospora sp. MAA19 TaxID=3035090 RepID=UPI0024743048|nr:RDD family protein [Kitasatospora sp. MAA19]
MFPGHGQVLTSHGRPLGTAEQFGTSLWDSAVLDVQEAFAALALATFAYQFMALVLTNRTLGELLLGLRVSGVEPGRLGRRRAAIRATVTTLADVGCFAVACCALVGGSVAFSVLCWAVAVAVFWANALPALLGRRRSLADRLAGTTVGNITLPRPGWDTAQQGVRQAVDLGRTGARGGRAAWENVIQSAQDSGQKIVEHEAVRRVVDSELSRAAAGKGRAAFDRAKAAATRKRPEGSAPLPPHPYPPHPFPSQPLPADLVAPADASPPPHAGSAEDFGRSS